MRLEVWPQLNRDRWGFLKKVASGVSGRYCEVIPRWSCPSTACVPPYPHFSRIYLPPTLSGVFLDGVLAHELLHVMASQPQAFSGIPWGVFLIANCLEDARVEAQLGPRWVGLAQRIAQANREVAQFRLRERDRDYSKESRKIIEVGIALYWLLSGSPFELVANFLEPMAVATARELLPLALPALGAPDSFAVVEIAKKLMEEIVRAAERAAAHVQSSSAYAWVSSLRTEVQAAMRVTVEEVLRILGQPKWAGDWWGPWSIGRGVGFTFYPTPWSWDPSSGSLPIAGLSPRELLAVLERVDPTKEIKRVVPLALYGTLLLSPQVLVKAALGKERRVFIKYEQRRAPLLPRLLKNLEVILFVEAHQRYTKEQGEFLRGVVASLARLFALVGVSLLVVRACSCVRKKEVVEDPETKRKWERWTDEVYVRICTLKNIDDPWGEAQEHLLAAMPLEGFNNPLEAYARLKAWELKLPTSTRPRVYVCVGTAREINVREGYLCYATECLRKGREKAVYVHIGSRLLEYEDGALLNEFRKSFDAFVQGGTISEIVLELLRAFLEILA